MKIHLIYFSPGGTTRKTVRTIAQGIGAPDVIEHDMMKKENREKKLRFGKDNLVILGMMTATKLFGFPEEIIGCMEGDDTPLVGVVMFGNGYFGNSLNIMRKVVRKKGFRMIAAGAFIGQHTFRLEIARNRPDAQDIEKQLAFGKSIHTKLFLNNDRTFKRRIRMDWPRRDRQGVVKCALIASMPGISTRVPYKWTLMKMSDDCIECGACEKKCPTGAVQPATRSFDESKCIGCFACGNICPQKAITMTHPGMNKIVDHCVEVRKERREPVIYI